MAQYFLAGVGVADLFDENDNLFATAKTLTDSSMNVTVSNEEVRGGEGAALLGKYFHTTGLTFTMTDAMFSIKYLAANVGASIQSGADIMTNETRESGENTYIELSREARPLGCDSAVRAWISEAGKDNWTQKEVIVGTGDKMIRIQDGIEAGKKYCVKYISYNANVEAIKINTQFIPSTLYVILTASLFAGDAKSKVGTKVGKVVIKIPRFQLNGEQEISMNMTGASTTNISGSALAVECSEDCETNAYYAEIIEVIEGTVWYDGAIALAVEQAERSVATGSTVSAPDVYAVFANKLPKRIDANTLEASGCSLVYAGDGIDAGTGVIESVATGTKTYTVALNKGGAQIGDLITTFTVTGE